jgi:hypothetical protein
MVRQCDALQIVNLAPQSAGLIPRQAAPAYFEQAVLACLLGLPLVLVVSLLCKCPTAGQ